MLLTRVLKDERETMAVNKALFGTECLPSYLFCEERYESVVIGLFEGNIPVGMEYGVVKKGETTLFIHFFFVKQAHRSLNVLIDFFSNMMKTAEEIYQIKDAYWKYERIKKVDPYEKLLNMSSRYVVEKCWEVRSTVVRTEDFNYLRKFRYYNPDFLDKKGFRAKLWSKYPELEKQKIRYREEKEKEKPDYLSPFIENEEWEADKNSSYVLFKEETGEPCGWILCEKITDRVVKLRRFYIYQEIRKICLGPAFSTYVLDRIAEQFDIMVFDVAIGNKQMERVMLKQFGPISVQSSYISNIKIHIN